MLVLKRSATVSLLDAARRALGVALTLFATTIHAQDVFSSGPATRQPQPLETARLCGRDPGPYIVRNPPSCARQIAEGERRFGVHATFVTLRESREIPASWMFASPTGPCAEGESLVFFTDAGRALFQKTAGQCDERFAGTGGGDERGPRPTPGPRPAPVPPGPVGPHTTTPSNAGGFACVEPPRGGRIEQVRGLPGGALCQLRENDELWCRQRNAMSYDPYLPTNAAWPMRPVGVRVLEDCTIVRSDPKAPPTVRTGSEPDPGYWKGVEAGLQRCGTSAAVLLQAVHNMVDGNFVEAARLLGVTDSSSALRALWEDWTQRQVIDGGAVTITEFDRGKRQAERVCLYVLLPRAQQCVVGGAACAMRTTLRSCGALMRRVGELRSHLPVFKGKPPPSPLSRGLLLPDEQFLQQLAATENKVIIVRDSNPWSMRWIGRDGYAPKPLDVKGKTLKPEDLTGLSAAERDRYLGLASAKGMTLDQRAELVRNGYKIASPGDQEIITGPKGERFYSDTDLHGVYNLDGTSGWSAELLDKLQCRFFDRGVQHGPHDAWPLRNDRVRAGPNYGPQVGRGKTLTAYLPDGRAYHITSLGEMKALYASFGADWRAIYPYH